MAFSLQFCNLFMQTSHYYCEAVVFSAFQSFRWHSKVSFPLKFCNYAYIFPTTASMVGSRFQEATHHRKNRHHHRLHTHRLHTTRFHTNRLHINNITPTTSHQRLLTNGLQTNNFTPTDLTLTDFTPTTPHQPTSHQWIPHKAISIPTVATASAVGRTAPIRGKT